MHATRSPRPRNLAFWAPALAAAIAALMTGAALAAPAHAAGAAHLADTPRQRTASFGGQASLASVSCNGASWCMAVGSFTTTQLVKHSLAMIWNGTTWRTLKNPPGALMTSVSCSSRTFCMASGGPTGAERWNGTTWRTMPAPKGGVFGVSCASHTLCMVIYKGLVRSWNGNTWHLWKPQTDFCTGSAPGPCGMASVSCGSKTNCVAVGTWTVSQEPVQNAVAVMWSGKSWSRDDDLPAAGGGAFVDVNNGAVAVTDTWNATTKSWTGIPLDIGTLCHGFQTCGWPSAIACASATSCMTLGAPGSQFWNGTTWKSAQAISAGRGSALQDVSCGGSDCLAVGFRTVAGKRRTLAELWNGSTWTIVKTPKGA